MRHTLVLCRLFRMRLYLHRSSAVPRPSKYDSSSKVTTLASHGTNKIHKSVTESPGQRPGGSGQGAGVTLTAGDWGTEARADAEGRRRKMGSDSNGRPQRQRVDSPEGRHTVTGKPAPPGATRTQEIGTARTAPPGAGGRRG